ncbi:E3 ubiquitin-protein ligase SIS3 [Cyclospora cayetanensis]|uniref:E3 ubiquitin-protein ligase SIS3 n=1 Tax=Cyclospora cayetanensis TaxID=88456 RepID=A0A6P6S262_9EIME|nr:E3 ubiquitin-protein ligase SIS3 [Cyclospora cayetanensis]
MVLSGFTLNDAILLFAFFYSSSDVFVEWDSFASCAKPIHYWLLGSYVALIAFRLSHYLGQYLSDDGDEDFILYRQRGPPFWVNVLILGVLFPCFFGWTILGTFWFLEVRDKTPYCLPRESHPWFFAFWLGLCYIWILIYIIFIGIAAVFEYRARRIEADLRILQNEDMIRRWGRLRLFSQYGIYIFRRGLTTEQIRKLPSHKLTCGPIDLTPCSICLEEFVRNDCVRVLQPCGHIFHKSCIDIWLLRNAVCPNCKSPICASAACPRMPEEEPASDAETCTTTPGRSHPTSEC